MYGQPRNLRCLVEWHQSSYAKSLRKSFAAINQVYITLSLSTVVYCPIKLWVWLKILYSVLRSTLDWLCYIMRVHHTSIFGYSLKYMVFFKFVYKVLCSDSLSLRRRFNITCSSIISPAHQSLIHHWIPNTPHIYVVYFGFQSYLLNLLLNNLAVSLDQPWINHTSIIQQPCISQACSNFTTHRQTTNTL